MADRIKFIIPGKPEYMTMVRLAIGSVSDVAGFNFEEIEDIKRNNYKRRNFKGFIFNLIAFIFKQNRKCYCSAYCKNNKQYMN